jgi:hypothetical protein
LAINPPARPNGRLRRTAVGLSPDWKFPLSNALPTYAQARRLRAKLDGGEGDEGGHGFGEVLEVLGETPVASEPGEGALDQLAAGRRSLSSSLRLTVSMRSNGTFATAASTCHAL